MVKLRTNDRVSIPRAVSKIVERSGEENKKTDREGREEEKLSLLQVRLRIWKREPRIESFGVQRRIENGTQTSIVPATSGIVKYDRLLVKWDQNIGCRLASILPLAFPSPVPALLPPLLLRRTTRDEPWNDHDDSPFLEIHFRFDWSRSQSLLLSPAPFLSGESIYLPRLRFYFHAVSLIFPYSWREAPFDRYNGKTNRITSLFNVLRDHGWDSPSFATNEIETFFKTDSCMTRVLLFHLSILIQKGKFFGIINNIRWIVSILIKHLDTVYDRSQEKLRAIRLKASRWTHCKESI